ncbi:MAG: PHP domain-containing protein [Candidatus Aenigmarchaeota archaeon]|nr:PHP domain-containing protein [Candidatus Aenigmarchaeota archaeon]
MLVELQCHSEYSGDTVLPVKDIIRKADAELGAIAITDHNSLGGYLAAKKMKKRVILIPGTEITCFFGRQKGHLIALGVEYFPKKYFNRAGVFDVIDYVKSNAGITIVSHPFRSAKYSFHQKDVWKKAEAIEVLNGNTLAFRNTRAYTQAKEMKKPMTSGSDAHILKAVGSYACGIEAESVDGILTAIKKGRVVLPQKSTNALDIILGSAIRRSKKKLRKIIGKRI